MKKYLKNVAVAILINVAIIPAILLQAYYIGGESCYYSEVIDPKNLENLVTFMTLSGAWYGFYLTLFVNTVINVEKNKESVKPVLFAIKTLVIAILVALVLIVPVLFNIFSDTMLSLIELNACIIFIILMMTTIIKESSEIKKINKKIKEKNKN